MMTIILVIAIGSISFKFMISKKAINNDEYTIIESGSNIDKINVKGEVKSDNTTKIYSDVSLPIKEVKVDFGDRVNIGDVLAVLDTRKLEDQIKEKEVAIATVKKENKIQMDSAKAEYDNAVALSSYDNNADIRDAVTNLNKAKLDYENKEELYNKNLTLYDNNAICQEDLNQSKIAYENSKYVYDNCVTALDNVKSKVELGITLARHKYEAAKVKYDDKSQDVVIENLKQDLEKSLIKSSANGIISVKNAVEGNMSSGELFEIEDENDIIVSVDVKEVDISKIKTGQKVEIKTDATGTNIIYGEVTTIQPLANIDEKGILDLEDDSDDKEAKFEVKIKPIGQTEDLKIGMKANVNIILNEETDSYIVSDESVIKDKDNNDCLYIADKQGENYVIKKIIVTKGTETDTEVEILGQDLKEGMILLKNPLNYKEGDIIIIK